MTLLEYLDQGDVWTTREGDTLRVSEMEPSHARNLIGYLERRAHWIKFAADLRFACLSASCWPNGDMAQLALEEEQQAMLETPALEWLAEQPLVQALNARLAVAA